MNKNNISKIKMFFMGLESRFEDNKDIFKLISVDFKTGLKHFKGNGVFKDGVISYNFNGKTENMTIKEVFKNILEESEKYESAVITYCERGSKVIITADSKGVKMNTSEDDSSSDEVVISKSSNGSKYGHIVKETSTLLNRNYFI